MSEKGFRLTYNGIGCTDEMDIHRDRGVGIEAIPISVRYPGLDYEGRTDEWKYFVSLAGSVRWDNHHKMYHPQVRDLQKIERLHYIAAHNTMGPRDEVLYKEHEKIFNDLKKKFGMKKRGAVPKQIKDGDLLRDVEKHGLTKS